MAQSYPVYRGFRRFHAHFCHISLNINIFYGTFFSVESYTKMFLLTFLSSPRKKVAEKVWRQLFIPTFAIGFGDSRHRCEGKQSVTN